MVVREAFGFIVRRLPYSGYLPKSIIGHEDDSKTEEPAPSMGISTSAELSPRDTIHNRIISKRAEKMDRRKAEYSTLDLSCLNYCDTFDDSSIETSPINRLKSNEAIDKIRSDVGETNETLIASSANLNKSYGVGNIYGRFRLLSTVEEKNEDSDIKALRLENYLSEQNKKFDDLVNKNLDLVLLDTSKDFKRNIIGLFDVYDYKIHDKLMGASNIIGIAFNNVLGFTPFKKYDAEVSENGLDLESSKVDDDAANDEFDHIMKTIDNKSSMDSLLVSLDYDTKVDLFAQLKEELCYDEEGTSTNTGIVASDKRLYNDIADDPNPSDLLIDKLQMCIIISIKLLFTGIKLTIPLSKLLYQKFKSNEMFIVNNRNANKFLSFIIRLMRSLESQLNNDKLVNYRYGYENGTPEDQLQLNQLYDELTSNNGLIRLQFGNQSNDSSSWKKAMMEHILLKYINGETTTNKKSDPKYSKFFSHLSTPVSSSSSYSFNLNSKSNSRASARSSSPNDSLSMLKIAEQFVDEF